MAPCETRLFFNRRFATHEHMRVASRRYKSKKSPGLSLSVGLRRSRTVRWPVLGPMCGRVASCLSC